MVGSAWMFWRTGFSEAFISTVTAARCFFATPWNKANCITRMFSCLPRILTHLQHRTQKIHNCHYETWKPSCNLLPENQWHYISAIFQCILYLHRLLAESYLCKHDVRVISATNKKQQSVYSKHFSGYEEQQMNFQIRFILHYQPNPLGVIATAL